MGPGFGAQRWPRPGSSLRPVALAAGLAALVGEGRPPLEALRDGSLVKAGQLGSS